MSLDTLLLDVFALPRALPLTTTAFGPVIAPSWLTGSAAAGWDVVTSALMTLGLKQYSNPRRS